MRNATIGAMASDGTRTMAGVRAMGVVGLIGSVLGFRLCLCRGTVIATPMGGEGVGFACVGVL